MRIDCSLALSVGRRLRSVYGDVLRVLFCFVYMYVYSKMPVSTWLVHLHTRRLLWENTAVGIDVNYPLSVYYTT
jgi:hypothetical protein